MDRLWVNRTLSTVFGIELESFSRYFVRRQPKVTTVKFDDNLSRKCEIDRA